MIRSVKIEFDDSNNFYGLIDDGITSESFVGKAGDKTAIDCINEIFKVYEKRKENAR